MEMSTVAESGGAEMGRVLSVMDILIVTMNKLTGSSQSSGEFEELFKRSEKESEVNGEVDPIKTQTILIERIFLRYHSDAEYIGLTPFSPDSKVNTDSNPFAFLVESLGILCEKDEGESVRVILMGLKPNVLVKIIKTGLLIGIGTKCATIKIFLPAWEHDLNWQRSIINTISCKSLTASTLFWSNWFRCVFESAWTTEAWKVVSEHWMNTSFKHNPEIFIPATYAVLAIFREAKTRSCTREWGLLDFNLHQYVTACMGSLNLDIRDCSLIVAYVLADIHNSLFSIDSKAGDEYKLSDICSDRPLFKRFKNFYTYEECLDLAVTIPQESISTTMNRLSEQIESLSSSSDTSTLTDAISFNEIYESIVEGKLEEKDKKFYVLRICVQLASNMGLDPDTAVKLTRVLCELEGDELLTITSTLAITEMSKVQPEQVFSSISDVLFDTHRYTVGQRIRMLEQYNEIMELRSGTKCLYCYPIVDEKFSASLTKCDPEFVQVYMKDEKTHKKCFKCVKKYGPNTGVSPEQSTIESNKPVIPDMSPQEVKERKIEAKTKRFNSKSNARGIIVEETFSTTVAPKLWFSICAPLLDPEYLNTRNGGGDADSLDDYFLLSCLQFLQNVIICTTPRASVFYTTYAPGVSGIMKMYGNHPSKEVRFRLVQVLTFLMGRASDVFRLYESLVDSPSCSMNMSKLFYSDAEDKRSHLVNSLLVQYKVTPIT